MTRLLRATRLVVGPLLAASCMFAVNATAQTLPVLSIDSPSVNEGDSGSTNLVFTVTLSAASASTVTVQYADAGTGTATSGTDYTAVSAGMLSFAAGTTSQTITVAVQGDTTSEPDETVVITLGNAVGATVSTAPRIGRGTIEDNDTLSINSPFVTEGDSGSANLVFTVSLSGSKTTAVTVNYADAGTGTATSGTDYTAVTAGMLSFAAGTTSQTITVSVTGDMTVESDETVVIALSSASGATLSATASSGTGTIRDDDTSTPTFSINSPTVTEGDSGSTNMNFTVTLNPAANRSTRVIFGITGGTATSGTDYTTSLLNNRVTLRFNAGETSKTVSVAVQGDTLDEPDETVVAQLSGAFPPFAARIGAGMGTGTGTITDDDTSDVTIDSPTVAEGDTGSTNMTFTVSLSTANSRQVTMPWGVGTALSSATRGTDYRTTATIGNSADLTFAPGETSKTVTVEILGDRTDEPDETVIVQLGTPTNANLESANRRGTGTITDDDLAWLRTGPVSVAEGDSGSTNLNFTITLSDPAGEAVTVAYADTGRGTATSGTDYTALAAGTLTIAQGTTTGTIAVEVTGDTVTERHETVVLALSNPTNARFVTASMATWTGTIRDDDGFPTANAGADQTVNEGATVTLTGSGSDPDGDPITSYRWTQTAGPAVTLTSVTTATTSFTAPTGLVADEVLRFSLVVEANDEGASDSVDILVNATTLNWSAEAGPNQTVEEENTASLSGMALSGGTELTLLGVGQPSYSWRHTGGGGTAIVNLTGAETATPSFTAPNLLANDDLTFTLTVTVGNNTRTDTVVVTVEADNDDPTANAGPDQTVYEASAVTLSGSGSDPEGESLSYSWSQTGGIPMVALTGATSPTPRFTAPLTMVDLTLTFTLTVTAGGASHTDTVEVTVEPLVLMANAGPDQVVDEGDTVRLDGRASTAPLGAPPLIYSWRQTGGSPAVTLTGATTATPSFTAPSGLTADVTLTFTLSVTVGGESAEIETDTVDITVEWFGPIFTPELLTADAGPDQTVNPGQAVSLDGTGSTGPFGEELTYSWRQTGGSPTVSLTGAATETPSFTAPDVTADVTLTFSLTVTLGAGTENPESDTDTVNVTVSAGTVSPLLVADAGPDQTVYEGDAVSLDGSGSRPAVGWPLEYSWSQTGGSPTVTLTGAATATPSFTAPDVTAGDDVTLTFSLTVSLGTDSDTDTVDVTISAYDAPTLSVDSPRVNEGNDGTTDLMFTVSLSAASSRQVTVAYATADGTATAGADYRAASGELRFAPGETELMVSVPVLGDLTPEADETLTVTLSDPVNAELGSATATGTIVNDDTAGVSIADARAEEGDDGAADLDFAVTLSTASEIEVTVAYATADGTASAGADYRAANGELRFAPGETELTVSVPVLGDLTPEADETFTVTLSAPVNAELGRATATGVIVNDDVALVSVADARAEEGDNGTADLGFTVTLSAASEIEVTVAYATADGTASAGTDYRTASGELRFAPGDAEMTFSVPVLGDLTPEADETFTVTLSAPVNAELERATATGLIVNDDTALASIADARAEEGDGGAADLDFTVTLSVASDLEVTVAYATADGTANAGSDYQAASGELRFAPGETELAVSVPVLGDQTPEADETFTVALSAPVNVELGAATAATGVIVDDDVARARDRALEASLAGFGRTLTWDAVGAISGRFKETPAAQGSQMTLGGGRLPSGDEDNLFSDRFGDGSLSPWASEAGWNPTVQALGSPPEFHDLAARDPHGPRRSQLSLRDFLQQSSFNLALAEGDEGDDEGWDLSLWGRASSGRFSGQPSSGLSSRGEVVTGYLGMDAQVGERLFAGVALAHSDGDMGYGIADFAGQLDVSLTSVLPYVSFQLSEKLEIWSVVGVGWGDGDFRDAVRSGQTELQDAQGTLDLGFSMVALGANRALATWRNMDLELKSDAFVMQMEGDPDGSAAQPKVKARAQGIRLSLAGHRELMTSEQGHLEANLEFGGRWDGGDAQTGWGTEVGGGLDYRHAHLGLGVALQGRYLLVHQAQSFDDKGVSLTLEFDPGVRGQGFSLALRPAWGAHSGAAGELWNDEALLHLGGGAGQFGPDTASERLDFEWGYGFGAREGGSLLRLQGGLSHQGMGQRGYRFGGFLNVSETTRCSVELNRQEALGKPSHGLLIKWEHSW